MVSGMRQAERVERSTNAMLDAAADLVIESGYDGLSLAAVGDLSGFSRGLVTARFGSKDGLVGALMDRAVTRWRDVVLEPVIGERSGLEHVAGTYEVIAKQWVSDPTPLLSLWALLFSAIGSDGTLRSRGVEHNESARSRIEGWILDGQKDGSVRPDIDAHEESVHEVAVLRGFGYDAVMDRSFDVTSAFVHAAAATRQRIGVTG